MSWARHITSALAAAFASWTATKKVSKFESHAVGIDAADCSATIWVRLLDYRGPLGDVRFLRLSAETCQSATSPIPAASGSTASHHFRKCPASLRKTDRTTGIRKARHRPKGPNVGPEAGKRLWVWVAPWPVQRIDTPDPKRAEATNPEPIPKSHPDMGLVVTDADTQITGIPCKESMIELLAKVVRVSVETVAITSAMAGVERG